MTTINRGRRIATCVLFAAYTAWSTICFAQTLTSVGVAKVDITPKHPVVLAGYGSRRTEFEGFDQSLWARALVIGDKEPVAIVAIDNCGAPAAVTRRLTERLAKDGFTSDRVVVAATHTHNAPNLVGYASILWAGRTTKPQQERMEKYTAFLVEKMQEAIKQAAAGRRKMHLEFARGRATFGGNRRVLQAGRWSGFGFQQNRPVDHSLPVLVARTPDGKVQAIWANYACHCTTVGSRNRVGGDWAGYANHAIEQRFPHATALVTIGCGADIGPQPSGNLEIAERHGNHLAEQVALAITSSSKRLAHAPIASTTQVKLPLAPTPDRAHWERLANTATSFHQQHALSMLKTINTHGALPSHVDYPITTWQFADDLLIVFLGGEVVVDYSVRLNHELDWNRLWITAWANHMPGYIPSRRVLAEGGYEAEFSQIYYNQPGPYAPEIEDILVEGVKKLAGSKFAASSSQSRPSFHTLPSKEEETFAQLQSWVRDSASDEERELLGWIRTNAPRAVQGVASIEMRGEQATEWYNYAGDFRSRRFIRQQRTGETISWRLPSVDSGDSIFTFLGGLGWSTQPKSKGFQLYVDDLPQLTFDVVNSPTKWTSADGKATLIYLPTWKSDVDSAGFFFLQLQGSSKTRRTLSVRALGEGSKRWFAIDEDQILESKLKRLLAALRTTE